MATIRDLLIGVGYDLDQKSVKAVEGSINSIKSFATKALGLIGIGFSLVSLKNISEEFNSINDKIRDSTRGMGEQSDIQQAILKYANDARQSYADMADTVGKLARNTETFSGVEDAANFASLMYKNFMATGKSASESNALVKQMTTSLSKGVADTRVMNALFKESPDTMLMMANSLGVSIDALKEMMSKGQISAKAMKDIFEKNAGSIEDRFGELDFSISDAMQSIRDDWGLFVDEMNSSLGITKTIAKYMVIGFGKVMDALKKVQDWVLRVSNKLGGMKNMLKLVAIVGGTIFAALNAKKILAFLGSVKKLLTFTTLKIMAVVAAVVLLALLVEDFMAFLRGDNSLIGEMFKKFGINAEEAREKVLAAFKNIKTKAIQIWNDIKTNLDRIWTWLKTKATQVFGSITEWLAKNWPLLEETVTSVWKAISSTLGTIWDTLSEIFTTVFGMFKKDTDDAGESAGGFGDVITTMLEKIRDFSNWISENQGLIRMFAVELEAIVAVVLGIVAAFKIYNIVTGIVGIVTKAAASPIFLVIAALVALTVIIYLIIKNWYKIKEVFLTVWESIRDKFSKIAQWIMDKVIQPIVDSFSGLRETLSGIVASIVEKIKGFFTNAIDWVKEKWDTFKEFFFGLWEEVKNYVSGVVESIKEFFAGVIDWVKENWESIVAFVINPFVGIFKYFYDNFEGFRNFIDGVWDKIKTGFQEVVDFFKGAIDSIVTFFQPLLDIIGKIADFLGTGIGNLKEKGKEILDKINPFSKKDKPKPGSPQPGSYPAFGSGTNRTPETFIAGDGGPELITGAKGRTVFTALETGNIFQTLKDIVSLGARPSAAMVNGMASSVENKSIIQNVEINNKFEGERAGQKKSAEAMDKAADDTIGQLSRALTFARG